MDLLTSIHFKMNTGFNSEINQFMAHNYYKGVKLQGGFQLSILLCHTCNTQICNKIPTVEGILAVKSMGKPQFCVMSHLYEP